MTEMERREHYLSVLRARDRASRAKAPESWLIVYVDGVQQEVTATGRRNAEAQATHGAKMERVVRLPWGPFRASGERLIQRDRFPSIT